MLDSLMRIGSYRVEHFECCIGSNPKAFGFYIRGDMDSNGAYSHDAKTQLYAGLMLIHEKGVMNDLRGIYLDVDSVANVQRPAYNQLKTDLLDGLFKRVLVLHESALLGTPETELDLLRVYQACGGFELFVCRDGDCIPYYFLGNAS